MHRRPLAPLAWSGVATLAGVWLAGMIAAPVTTRCTGTVYFGATCSSWSPLLLAPIGGPIAALASHADATESDPPGEQGFYASGTVFTAFGIAATVIGFAVPPLSPKGAPRVVMAPSVTSGGAGIVLGGGV